jgi:hypothetical protein
MRFGIAFAVLTSTALPALAQSASAYDLSGLKAYDAPIAPPANGLARVIRSEKQPAVTPSKFKPAPPVTVSIGCYGEVVVGSRSR